MSKNKQTPKKEGLNSNTQRVCKGGGEGLKIPHWPEEKEEKNALLAHLRRLFAAIGASNDF